MRRDLNSYNPDESPTAPPRIPTLAAPTCAACSFRVYLRAAGVMDVSEGGENLFRGNSVRTNAQAMFHLMFRLLTILKGARLCPSSDDKSALYDLPYILLKTPAQISYIFLANYVSGISSLIIQKYAYALRRSQSISCDSEIIRYGRHQIFLSISNHLRQTAHWSQAHAHLSI